MLTRVGTRAHGWGRHAALAAGAVALVALLGVRPAGAAEAVFDAEFWIDTTTTGVERVDDLAACADGFTGLRRSIRSTSPTNRVVYQLRVGQAADEGVYEMWARLQIPPGQTRTILVGQDNGGAFQEPQDRFVVTRTAGSGYTWERLTRQGTGAAGAPEQDPWPVTLSMTGSDIELRLVENDILVDRFAISNQPGYLPPDCPVDLTDGGPTDDGGDADYRGARAAGCAVGEYYDRVDDRCRAPVEHGCAAVAPAAAALGVALLAAGVRRRRTRTEG